MLARPPLNSELIRQRFPDVYRHFFSRCQQVASASNSFLWTGEFAGFYGGLTVSQKLPFRTYVGFERTDQRQVSVNRQYMAYAADEDRFEASTIDDRLCHNLTEYLEQRLAPDPNFTGLTVHLLTELPLGHSLGANGAIAAAIALLIEPTDDFDQLFGTARHILSLSQAGVSSGVSAYMALTDCQVPIVFSTRGSESFARPLDELADQSAGVVWPIDFGLIYSGSGANGESVIRANQQTAAELTNLAQKLETVVGGERPINFQRTYIEMLDVISSFVVTALTDLFRLGVQNALLAQLFNSLNQYQNLLHILHISTAATDTIYRRIHELASKQTNEVGSGVKISGIGKGGAVLFAVPYGMHRQAVIDLVASLREELQRPIWLDYASWLDGIGGPAGRIEQDLERGLHSAFIDRDSLLVRILAKGRLREERLTAERFRSESESFDIVLDVTNGKLMIAGQAMTSKELPSQKATVAILDQLLRQSNLTLTNDQLPGSYGASRYDLQGKIVIPLTKQIKAITDRDLQLTIRGGSYDDYALVLEPSNITIAVIAHKD